MPTSSVAADHETEMLVAVLAASVRLDGGVGGVESAQAAVSTVACAGSERFCAASSASTESPYEVPHSRPSTVNESSPPRPLPAMAAASPYTKLLPLTKMKLCASAVPAMVPSLSP